VTTSYAGDPVEAGWSTDGRATGDVELRLVNDELQVRGSELFVGYDDPVATAAVLDDDGWYRTGDRASLTNGWLTAFGRLDDTIIRGGENVMPGEVESVCASLRGVGQAIVVGYPDDEMGERIGLVVVGREPTVDEVRAHCAAAGLARFKTPERIVRVDVMPILTVGKPDRETLKSLFG
jgi:acyl-CoA synthetase (AMP-forming)/AMP-acid ligase II